MNPPAGASRFFVSTFESQDDVAWRPTRGNGNQIGVELNTAHPFYQMAYVPLHNKPRAMHALDLLLLTFAKAELDGGDKARTFYEGERREWSRFLSDSLAFFKEMIPLPEQEEQHDS